MGASCSREAAAAEQNDAPNGHHPYRYPPAAGGNYFGSHFIMGGERFDTPQPEAYLFGENADLNFLGGQPTPFPYPPPQASEPTKTLKSLVNVRKESLRFVRAPKGDDPDAAAKGEDDARLNVEFSFDADARCTISIHYFCTEEVGAGGVAYQPRDPALSSRGYRYKRGANQHFSQPAHTFDPSAHPDRDLAYHADRETLPVVIHCVVDEGPEELRQSHTTIAVVEKHSDGTYVLKALKQKLFVDGLCYLLQELYGIENKNTENSKLNGDEDGEDNGSECVICMSDVRDTLILPCRHLCLCNSCADSLRYQANNCPICRAPFRALLQIRALQKQSGAPQILPASPPDGSNENIPAGYKAVSLIEALNGPCPMRVAIAPPTPQSTHQSLPNNTQAAAVENEPSVQISDPLSRCNLERRSSGSLGGNGKIKNGSTTGNKTKDLEGKSPRDRALGQGNGQEFRMSVLINREEENNKNNKINANSPLLANQKNKINHILAQEKKVLDDDDYNLDDLENELEIQEGELDCEADSETEKLSPLLTTDTCHDSSCVSGKSESTNLIESPANPTAARVPLHLEAVLEPIDDTDTDEPEQLSSASVVGPPCVIENETGVVGEDSDYFTPEDTHTTILSSPNQKANVKNDPPPASSTESTPQRWALPHHLTSLPGTPLSHLSNRSSGDSYSSSSSTKQLLANINTATANSVTHHPLNPISNTVVEK